jgi:hypothetical protein
MPFTEITKGEWGTNTRASECRIGIYKNHPGTAHIVLTEDALDHIGSVYVVAAFGTGQDAGMLYLQRSFADNPNAYKITGDKVSISTGKLGLKRAVVSATPCPYELEEYGIIIDFRPVIRAQANGAARAAAPAKIRRIELHPAE